MEAGRLREVITLQDLTVSRGTSGSEQETYSDWATVRAAVEPISGREFVSLQAAQIEVTTRFLIRYRLGVHPRMRIIWRGAYYRIAEVIEVGAARRDIEILATGSAV